MPFRRGIRGAASLGLRTGLRRCIGTAAVGKAVLRRVESYRHCGLTETRPSNLFTRAPVTGNGQFYSLLKYSESMWRLPPDVAMDAWVPGLRKQNREPGDQPGGRFEPVALRLDRRTIGNRRVFAPARLAR